MSTRFVLVRHGTCALTDRVLLGRAVDSPLDEAGVRQAQALARHFESAETALIEASPRRRTRQTASAIAGPRRGVRTSTALDELDFGRWSGVSFEKLDEDPEWRDWNARRSRARTPAGEDIAGVQARLAAHVGELARDFAGGIVVLVTHAEIIRALVLKAFGMSPDDFHRIEIRPASLTTLTAEGAHLRVDSVNEEVAA